MDPHLPFLKAIAADPADDLPRLVYADFLEETGEPDAVARAHFIRTQIAANALPPDSPEHDDLMNASFEVLWQHLRAWSGILAEVLGAKVGAVVWRRGFPHCITLSVSDLVRHGPTIFERFPIEGLRLEQEGSWDTSFESIHFLSRVKYLHVGSALVSTRFHELMDVNPVFYGHLMSPFLLPSLRTLDLSYRVIPDSWLVRFVSHLPSASFATTLEELDLSNCHNVTDAGANTLATARGLDRLKMLRLVGVTLSDASVAMLRRRFGSGLQI